MAKQFDISLAELYASRETEAFRSLDEWYGAHAETIVERTSLEGVLEKHRQHAGNPQFESAIEKLGRSVLTRESADVNTIYGIDVVLEIMFQAIADIPAWHTDPTTFNFGTYLESILAFEGLATLIRDTNEWIVMPNAAAYVLLRLWFDCYYNG